VCRWPPRGLCYAGREGQVANLVGIPLRVKMGRDRREARGTDSGNGAGERAETREKDLRLWGAVG